MVEQQSALALFSIAFVSSSAFGNSYWSECRKCRLENPFRTMLVPTVLDTRRCPIIGALNDLLALALINSVSSWRVHQGIFLSDSLRIYLLLGRQLELVSRSAFHPSFLIYFKSKKCN